MSGITQAAKHYRHRLEDLRGGRFREAVRHLRKAVEVNPANVDWRYDLSVALQKAGFRIYREAPATGWGGALAQLTTDLAAALAAQRRPAAAYD